MLVEEERCTFVREHHRNTRQVRPKLLQQLFSDMFKETFHVNYFVSDIILTFLLYFFYLVAVDVPEVAGDVLVAHGGEETHVFAYLVGVVGLG